MSESSALVGFGVLSLLLATFCLGWIVGWGGIRRFNEDSCIRVEVKKNNQTVAYWECR